MQVNSALLETIVDVFYPQNVNAMATARASRANQTCAAIATWARRVNSVTNALISGTATPSTDKTAQVCQ